MDDGFRINTVDSYDTSLNFQAQYSIEPRPAI